MIITSSGSDSPCADPSSALAKIFTDCKDLSPDERGKYLETCKALEAAHTSTAQGGQTAAPDINDEVDFHFSAFVAGEVDGQRSIIELDGGRKAPVVHGPLHGDLLEVRKVRPGSASIPS